VDDYLAAGGDIRELVHIGRESSPALPLWVKAKLGGVRNASRIAREIDNLSLFAQPETGVIDASANKLARVMNVSRSSLQRDLEVLRDLGAITVDGGSLQTGPTYRGRSAGWEWVGFDCVDRPLIRLNKELRAHEEDIHAKYRREHPDPIGELRRAYANTTDDGQWLEKAERMTHDGEVKGRARKGLHAHLRRDKTMKRNSQIVRLHEEGLSYEEIGRRVGVRSGTAWNVVRDWKRTRDG
jgi:DNA-binding transcriptional ArsR family regulator